MSTVQGLGILFRPASRPHRLVRGFRTTSVAQWRFSPVLKATGTRQLDAVLPLIIGGQEVVTPTTFPVISPLTGKEIWSSSSSSRQDAIDAADAAQRAFPAWSRTKPSERRDIFLRAADIIDRRRDELKHYI